MHTRMVQIRNVPESLHRTLKTRAAQVGMSLSDYLLRELAQVANRPTLEEMLVHIRQRQRPRRNIDSVAALRAERETRQ